MRRMSIWYPCFYGLILGFFSSQSAFAFDSPSDLTEVRRQLQTGWEQLKKLDEAPKTYDVLQVVKSTQTRPDREAREGTVRTQVGVDWTNLFRRVHMVNDDPKKPPVGYGRNPDYAFIVAKADSGWRLQGYNHAKPKTNRIDHDILDTVPMRDILYPLSSSFFELAIQTELLNHKNFQLTDFKKMPDDRASVHFTFQFALPDDPKQLMTFDGDMLVNPNRCWVVEEWSYSGGDGPKFTVSRSVTAADDAPDMILCRSMTKQGPIDRMSFAYENYSVSKGPIEQYRLSYYGLPEPGAAPKSSNWFFWLTLVALGVLGLAIVCWTIARRIRLRVQ